MRGGKSVARTLFFEDQSAEEKQRNKRVLIALLVAILLHVFFMLVAPLLTFNIDTKSKTEIEQISPQDLARLKNQILKRERAPLLQQELRDQYKSKEIPKDAQFMAPHNQVVPEQTVAGAQNDVPLNGGAGGSKSQQKNRSKEDTKNQKLDLSKIGLGNKVPPPRTAPREDEGQHSPLQGPPGAYRPLGRDDPKLRKSNQNLLNAVESQYYSFFARFEEPIIRNWFFLIRNNESRIESEAAKRRLRAGDEVYITVEFIIDKRGNFKSIRLVQESGLQTLDWATKEAVYKLRSIPNPPPGIFEGKDEFAYRLQFSVIMTDSPFSNQTPGLNWY